jgi:hypothetical protein
MLRYESWGWVKSWMDSLFVDVGLSLREWCVKYLSCRVTIIKRNERKSNHVTAVVKYSNSFRLKFDIF